jgi:hypothetical protein
MKITLEDGPFATFVIRAADGRTILVQTDWDYPGLAATFGWVACDFGDTDGTVDCLHRTASRMMREAYAYLSDHVGDSVDDPGYF